MATNVSKKPFTCTRCGKDAPRTSNRQMYCEICSAILTEVKHKDYCKKYHKDHYTKLGYNQLAENNNNWTGGIGTYRKKKQDILACERCGSENNLLIHHKDQDRYNNEIANLEKICKKCHQIEHECWKVLPVGAELASIQRKLRLEEMKTTPIVRDENGQFVKKDESHKV